MIIVLLRYISIQKYRQINTGEQEMAIREVDVILYCGQPSATSGDVCQDNAQSEDDCTLLSSTEGREYRSYKNRKYFLQP